MPETADGEMSAINGQWGDNHIDTRTIGKARIDRWKNLGDTSSAYWAVFGFDQLLHQLTYLTIAVVLSRLA